MSIRNRDLHEDAINDIIDITEKKAKDDILYDTLLYYIEGDRKDFRTREIEALAKNVVTVYEFYQDEEFRDLSQDACWDKAVDTVLEYGAAQMSAKDGQTWNKLSDADQEEVEAILADWKELTRDIAAWERGNYDTRHRSRRGTSNRSSWSDRQGRTEHRPRNSTQSTSYFRQADNSRRGNASVNTTTGNSRAQAMIRARHRQQEERAERQRGEERTERSLGRGRNNGSANELVHKTYFTSLSETANYPKRPGQEQPPYYDPSTERLQVSLDSDGFITYKVLELANMNPEDHQNVIALMAYSHRRENFKLSTKKRVQYSAGGVEIDAMLVENTRVQTIMDEMRQAGKIKKEDTFMDLSEALRTEILEESSNRLITVRKQQASAEHAKLIAAGRYVNEEENMQITKIKDIKRDVVSPRQAVNYILSQYGDQLNNDRERYRGYRVDYNTIDILARFDTPALQQIASNYLTGLYKKNATIQNIHASLSMKDIPLSVFTLLNRKATEACNLGIKYIFEMQNVHMDDFQEDINDFSQFVQNCVADGRLTNDKVNTFNRFVSDRVACIGNPTNDTLRNFYPNLDEVELERLRAHNLFTISSGKVIYVPSMSSELGLTQEGVQYIERKRNETLSGLFPVSEHHGANDLLVTHDNVYYQVILTDNDKVILNRTYY